MARRASTIPISSPGATGPEHDACDGAAAGADGGEHRRGRCRAPRRQARRLPDGDGLRPGRRRHRRPRRGRDLRSQRPAELQPADHPSRRSRGCRRPGDDGRARPDPGDAVLAWALDPGPAAPGGMPRLAAGLGGARYARRPGAAPSRGGPPAEGLRRADRRPQRQSLRAAQPHHGGPCRRRPRRPGGDDPR